MAKIYLVPTPIGNLEDITARALRILREADLIAAEDTRHSGKLLKHFEIESKTISMHAHNEHDRVQKLLAEIEEKDLTVAVISDAGTPGISDPGFLIIREALKAGIETEALPGPAAFVPALVNSGLPCDRFVFEGFLPAKKGRQTRLTELQDEKRTMIFYESPHRLSRTIRDLADVFGETRQAVVARELTKIHEEYLRGELGELTAKYEDKKVKGEIVIIVAGAA